VHIVAPPEKPDVKRDERDAVRIAREDSLGYLRRVYVPDPYVEEMNLPRSLVGTLFCFRKDPAGSYTASCVSFSWTSTPTYCSLYP
jgi:hypothetical protein